MANREEEELQRKVQAERERERESPAETGQAERLLAEQLLGGAADPADAQAEAVRKLPPRWEIRVQSKHDPVAEETRKYRSMAGEVDDRYDRRNKNSSDKPSQ